MTSARRPSAGSTPCSARRWSRRNPIKPIEPYGVAPDAGPVAPPPDTIVFRLESVEGGKLRGWIVDTLDPHTPVEFDLVIGGQVVAHVRADAERRDVARRFGTAGAHGFSVTVETAWSNERARSLRFQLADGRRVGPNKRLVIAAAPPVAADEEPVSEAERDLQRLTSALRRLQKGRLSAAADVRDLLERTIVRPVARRAFADQRWSDLAKLADLVQPSSRTASANQMLVARGLIYAGRAAEARALLLPQSEARAGDADWCFYYGLACSRADRAAEAIPWLERALAANPESHQFLRELALATARAARGGDQRNEVKTALRERAVRLFDHAAEMNKAAPVAMLLGAAQALFDLGRPDEAAARIEAALAREPASRQGLLLQSRLMIAAGNIADALAVSRRLLEVDPGNQAAQYQVRTLASLEIDVATRDERLAAVLDRDGGLEGWAVVLALLDPDTGAGDWLALMDQPRAAGNVEPLLRQAPRWCGRFRARIGDADVDFWRLDLLDQLRRSDLLVLSDNPATSLEAVAWVVATVDVRPDAGEPGMKPIGGTVICMSRHGIRKFGGGEHFLESMADHYASAGYDPLIVGAQPGHSEEQGVTPEGRRWATADANVDALRRFLVEQRPAAVHVLSGLGFEVAHALRYLDIPFVYGVHFWRDCLGAAEGTDRYFEQLDRHPIPRRLFGLVIERAAAIYTNSDYTRGVLEEAFRIRTPALYSLPQDTWPDDDREAALAITGGIEHYVLLLNARMDKGFGLLLDVAERTPDVPFLAVASQTDRAAALKLVDERALRNVHVIARTDRPDLLYRHALATAVPSYQFVETFSRVCIEAHRFGCPVIGSDRGNVPYLLREAGTVLPEKADLWAAEVARLARDPAYRAARQRLASENSERYPYGRQADAVARLIPKLRRRILVAVGSGLGNMLHVGPAIRAVARHFGQPVDIVVAEDHADSLFLLHDPAVVSEVFALGAAVLARAYDIVFVTSSFGEMRPPFAGRRVLYARDWQRFEAGGPLHETIHNLEAARVLLGVPWSKADQDLGYLGELAHRPPAGGRLVGFHGGSKDGFWASKRWPGHADLARRLAAHGWECASFGTPGEYVEGTIDRTGGSIAEMADAIRDCSYFVTNDSGVMNIANALGVPLTALFAPTNPATRAPLRSTSTFVQVAKSCSPCEVTLEGRETFYGGLCRCIGEIDVDTVEAHVLAHMATLGIAPAA